MGLELSSSFPEEPAIGPYSEPTESRSQPPKRQFSIILPSTPTSCRYFFPSGLSTKNSYALLLYPMNATVLAAWLHSASVYGDK